MKVLPDCCIRQQSTSGVIGNKAMCFPMMQILKGSQNSTFILG